MSSNDAIRLMHAVLDGEAAPAEKRELERLLDADPALRARYGQWQALFDAMHRVPPAWPPEGLVAAVMANIPQSPGAPGDQLSAQPRVFGVPSQTHRAIPATSAPIHRSPRAMAPLGETMSDQQNIPSSKRKIWIGAGLAAIAVIVVGGYALDVPPGSKDAVGTIVPVQKFVAPQNTAVDLAGRPRSEPGPGNDGRPRTEPLPAAGVAAGQAEGQAKALAAGQAEGQAKALAAGQAEGQAKALAAGQAEGQAKALAAGQAEGQAKALAAGQAEGQAKATAAGLAQGQAKANAAGQAEGQARATAAGLAQGQAKALAAGQAEGQAKALAAGQAEGQAKALAAGQAEGQAKATAAGLAQGQARANAAGQAEGQAKGTAR